MNALFEYASREPIDEDEMFAYVYTEKYVRSVFKRSPFEMDRFQRSIGPLKVKQLEELDELVDILFRERKVELARLETRIAEAKESLGLRGATALSAGSGAAAIVWGTHVRGQGGSAAGVIVATLAIATSSIVYTCIPLFWSKWSYVYEMDFIGELSNHVTGMHKAIHKARDMKQRAATSAGAGTQSPHLPRSFSLEIHSPESNSGENLLVAESMLRGITE